MRFFLACYLHSLMFIGSTFGCFVSIYSFFAGLNVHGFSIFVLIFLWFFIVV